MEEGHGNVGEQIPVENSDGDPSGCEIRSDKMQAASTDEGSSAEISPLRTAGVVIRDNCGSEKIVAGMAVTSPLFCKVALPRRIDWGIGLVMVEISLVSNPAHGAAISCSGLLSGGLGNVVAKVGHYNASEL